MKRIIAVLAVAALLAVVAGPFGVRAAEKEKTVAPAESTGTAAPADKDEDSKTDDSAEEEDEKGDEKKDDSEEAKTIELKNMKVFFKEQRIEIDATIGISKGLLELVACVPGAKTHETLLIMDINPSDLKAALLLIGLQDGFQLVTVRGKRTIDGERALINVEWTDKEGKKQSYRVEDLLYNIYTKKAMRHEGWVFIGSRYLEHPETGEKVFAARAQGNLIVTWHDFNAILDTPLPEGADDTTYRAYEGRVPDPGTEVKVIITPYEEHNKKWREKIKKQAGEDKAEKNVEPEGKKTETPPEKKKEEKKGDEEK